MPCHAATKGLARYSADALMRRPMAGLPRILTPQPIAASLPPRSRERRASAKGSVAPTGCPLRHDSRCVPGPRLRHAPQREYVTAAHIRHERTALPCVGFADESMRHLTNWLSELFALHRGPARNRV